MKTSDFDYYLPEELIAQTPLKERDEARLLVLHKKTGEIEHKVFKDILDYLEEGDALVINDTKVIPARIIGTKEDTGAIIEIINARKDNNISFLLTRIIFFLFFILIPLLLIFYILEYLKSNFFFDFQFFSF